jgi:hypothetical protein
MQLVRLLNIKFELLKEEAKTRQPFVVDIRNVLVPKFAISLPSGLNCIFYFIFFMRFLTAKK